MFAMYSGSPLVAFEDPRDARQRSRRIALRESEYDEDATERHGRGIVERVRSVFGHRPDDTPSC
jgi:hypothetical protein